MPRILLFSGRRLGILHPGLVQSLKELLAWKLVRSSRRPGDRREYFETSADVWELLRTIVRERKEREFDPTTRLLQSLVNSPDFARESADGQDRIMATLELMQKLGAWSDEMLRLSPATLDKILTLGATVQRFVRGSPAAHEPEALHKS